MSSLSRTFARESRRGKQLMKQYQPDGAYAAAEKWYRLTRETKKANRSNRLEVKP